MRAQMASAEMEHMDVKSPAMNASAAKARRQGRYALLARVYDPERGLEVYRHNCVGCHGTHGEGDGVGAAGLHPKPANLPGHAYSQDRLSFVLWNGVAGCAMPAWRDLPSRDLAAVAGLVRSFHASRPEPDIPAPVLELGGQVYAAHCAQCHGEKGAGDGSAVSELRIVPANFTEARPDLAVSLRALRNGVEGTPMAPWAGKLSEAELSAVAYYVRGFYRASNQ